MPLSSNLGADIAAGISEAFGSLATSAARLASGLRVESARDDAAGLAVREMLRSDIAAARQAAENVRNGISMVQAADEAAGMAADALRRMKELANQAMSGTLSTGQKGILQQEFEQMAEQVAEISQSTRFNSLFLFEDDQTIQIALGDGQTIDIETHELPEVSGDIISDASGTWAAIDAAIHQINGVRSQLGAASSRLEGAAEVLDVQAENILASESRISDVDAAHEVAAEAQNAILTQAAIAAQVQAQTMTSVVLTLLN